MNELGIIIIGKSPECSPFSHHTDQGKDTVDTWLASNGAAELLLLFKCIL